MTSYRHCSYYVRLGSVTSETNPHTLLDTLVIWVDSVEEYVAAEVGCLKTLTIPINPGPVTAFRKRPDGV